MFEILATIVLLIVLVHWFIVYKVKKMLHKKKPIGIGINVPTGDLYRLYKLSRRIESLKPLFLILLSSYVLSFGSIIGLILLIFAGKL